MCILANGEETIGQWLGQGLSPPLLLDYTVLVSLPPRGM